MQQKGEVVWILKLPQYPQSSTQYEGTEVQEITIDCMIVVLISLVHKYYLTLRTNQDHISDLLQIYYPSPGGFPSMLTKSILYPNNFKE